jgi:hypothetical protein
MYPPAEAIRRERVVYSFERIALQKPYLLIFRAISSSAECFWEYLNAPYSPKYALCLCREAIYAGKDKTV